MVRDEGHGFEIIQGRLSPARIHHAMRALGVSELALEWLIARVSDECKMIFGKLLAAQGVNLK